MGLFALMLPVPFQPKGRGCKERLRISACKSQGCGTEGSAPGQGELRAGSRDSCSEGAAPAWGWTYAAAGFTPVFSPVLEGRIRMGHSKHSRHPSTPQTPPPARIPGRSIPSGLLRFPASQSRLPSLVSPTHSSLLSTNFAPFQLREGGSLPVPAARGPHLDDRLQRGSVHDGGADDGIRILILSINLPHGKDHGDGQEEGGNPDAADELLGAAAGHDALGFEGVADGHVALHAEAGDVERRGVGAGIPEEVVALADRSSKSPGMMDPDEVVELDGHAEEEDEEVGEGKAGQVVMHGALQVLQRLLAHQRVRRDGVPHGAHEKESQIDDGHHDFGVDIGVDVQILLVGSFGEQVGAVGSVGVEVLGASGHGRGRGVGVHSVAGPPRRGCSSEPPHAPTYRCPQRGNLARFNAARRRRLPLPGCCARVSV